MEKLRLNLRHLEGVEVLSREEMKNVKGGVAPPGGVDCDNCPPNSQSYGWTEDDGTIGVSADGSFCPSTWGDNWTACHNYCTVNGVKQNCV